MTGLIAGFAACAAIIFFAGKKLSFYGDLIAEKTGLGRGWIGLILMASVTSLPELVVCTSAASFVQSPDLAVSDVLGGCAMNLAILAMMDAFVPRSSTLFSIASKNHILAAGMGIMLLCVCGIGMFLPVGGVFGTWFGIISFFCVIVYLISIRLIYKYEVRLREIRKTEEVRDVESSLTLKQLFGRYSSFAAMIVVAALFLPYFAEHIAEQAQLGKSFVGTFFLAASTSMPEMAVTLAAIRLSSYDLAVGNLLGSNIFNILILSIADLVYTRGVLLNHASEINIVSVFSIIIMTAIAVVGLTFDAGKKTLRLGWDAVLILIVYISNLFLLLKMS